MRISLFIAGCIFLTTIVNGVASSDPSPQYTLSESADVILAKVDFVKDGKISFSTVEVLKGKTHGPLLLTPGAIMEALKPGNECVLCYTGQVSDKNTVGESFMEGDITWVCMPVSNEGGKDTIYGVGSLEKVRAICASK